MYVRIQGIAKNNVVENLIIKGFISRSFTSLTSLFCDYSEFEIPIGHIFGFFIDRVENKVYEVRCKVLFVTQAWGLPYDVIPKGTKTLCFFEVDKKTKIIFEKRLPLTDTWFYNPDVLILSDTLNSPI